MFYKQSRPRQLTHGSTGSQASCPPIKYDGLSEPEVSVVAHAPIASRQGICNGTQMRKPAVKITSSARDHTLQPARDNPPLSGDTGLYLTVIRSDLRAARHF